MQYLPQRYHWNAFLFSIRPLQLRNPCIPDFDPHARTIEERLELEDGILTTIGRALDAASSHRQDDDERCYRFALKQIIFGYSLSLGWTLWAYFEQDDDPRILFRSLIESCCLEFSSKFETATYGPLAFRIIHVDRMDRAFETGEPDDAPRLSTFPEMKGILGRQPLSAERETKIETLRRMERNGDLSNNVRSLSSEARHAMFERFQSLYGQRILCDKYGNQVNGVIEEIVSRVGSKRSGIGGQPNKDIVVLEAFFTWLLGGEFHESLTKKRVINCIVDTAKDLSNSKIFGKGVKYRKVEQFLDENSYWVGGGWNPDNWQAEFNRWKTQLLAS